MPAAIPFTMRPTRPIALESSRREFPACIGSARSSGPRFRQNAHGNSATARPILLRCEPKKPGPVFHARVEPEHRHLPIESPTVLHKSRHPPGPHLPRHARLASDFRNTLQTRRNRADFPHRMAASARLSKPRVACAAAAAEIETAGPGENNIERIGDIFDGNEASIDTVRADLVDLPILQSAARRLRSRLRALAPASRRQQRRHKVRPPKSQRYGTAQFRDNSPVVPNRAANRSTCDSAEKLTRGFQGDPAK